MTRRRFATLDVFTEQPLAGNPLAVVLDSESLDDAAMQAIAHETADHAEAVDAFLEKRPANFTGA